MKYNYYKVCKEAIRLFEKIKCLVIILEDVTFISILFAYSFVGIVKEGNKYLKFINDYYHSTPTMGYYTHYSCSWPCWVCNWSKTWCHSLEGWAGRVMFQMNLGLPMLEIIIPITGIIKPWIIVGKATLVHTCLWCVCINTTCSKEDRWRLPRKIVERPHW